MADTTPAEITGTTPAGKNTRTVEVRAMSGVATGDVTLAIWGATGSFLSDIRLEPSKARELASALNNAATIAVQARKVVTR